MPVVAIYRFHAKFLLTPEARQKAGQDRAEHEGLLLLRQEAPERADAEALAVLGTRYLTIDGVIDEFGVLDARALARPEFDQYAALYKAALESGSALSYYDPSAYATVPDQVPPTGFRDAERR